MWNCPAARPFSTDQPNSIKHEAVMIHQRESLARWKALFPLDQRPPPSWDAVQNVVGPKEFSLFGQIAEIIADTPDLPEPVPADWCLWNAGEGPHGQMTKAAGLPYRPRGLKWPAFEGRPLAFLGQFCFADSLDLVGDLPAPILLVFSQPPGDYPGFRHYEWVSLG